MDQATASKTDKAQLSGPPKFRGFDHVSAPVRDLDESIRFYRDVLGGELIVQESAFALFRIADTRVGIGSAGCSFMTESAEYPHFAFKIGPSEIVQLKEWLTACGIPSSKFWTRQGIETLMFFRNPSGNVIELFCESGFDGAEDLPRGPARGHDITIDIDALNYTSWSLPD